MCGMVLYIGDSVPSVTGAACFFRWVSRSGTYRDGTAVGNVTNIVCISTPSSILVYHFCLHVVHFWVYLDDVMYANLVNFEVYLKVRVSLENLCLIAQ